MSAFGLTHVTFIPYFRAYLVRYFYNSKTRGDCQEQISDSYFTRKVH